MELEEKTIPLRGYNDFLVVFGCALPANLIKQDQEAYLS